VRDRTFRSQSLGGHGADMGGDPRPCSGDASRHAPRVRGRRMVLPPALAVSEWGCSRSMDTARICC
jgi:hypothetical protein